MDYIPSALNSSPDSALAALIGQQLSTPPSSVLGRIAQLISQLTRRGDYYCRQTIYLDGLTFEQCSFENCTLVTRTGTFILRNCRISGSETKFLYEGEALKIVRLHEFMSASVSGRSVFPHLLPQFNNDLHITVE